MADGWPTADGQRIDGGQTADGGRTDGEWWTDGGQTANSGWDCARRFSFLARRQLANIAQIPEQGTAADLHGNQPLGVE